VELVTRSGLFGRDATRSCNSCRCGRAVDSAQRLGDRADLIVVAQSLAAFVAPMLCERVDVRLLILVAPMIPSPGESPDAWWGEHWPDDGAAAAGRA
jgi:hypothetical protein